MISDNPPSRSRDELVGLVALGVCAFIAVTSQLLTVGLLPKISADLQISQGRSGLLLGVYAVLVMVLAVPITHVARAISGRTLVALAMGGYLLANTVCALAPNFWVLLGGRVLGGITHALFFSVCIGCASRLVPAARLGRSLAIVAGGSSAGFILGSPMSTAIGTAAGWRVAAAVLAVLAALALVVVLVKLPRLDPAVGAASDRQGRRPRAMAVVAGVNGLAYLGHFTSYTYIALLATQSGAPQGWVAPILMGFGIIGVIAMVTAAPRLDRHPERMAIGMLGLVSASLLLIGGVETTLPVVLLLMAGWSAGFGPMASLIQSASVRTRAFRPEIAGAWVNSLSNLGIAGGSLIGGSLIDQGGVRPLATIAGLILVGALALAVVGRRAFALRPGSDLQLPEPLGHQPLLQPGQGAPDAGQPRS